MADLTISSIRERLFNPTKHEKSVSRSSNPFAQTSFKGNVLTADVFVSENSKEKQDKVSFTGKLKASALVGSLSDINSKFRAGIETVVAFAKRMKDDVVNFWKTIDSMEVTLEPAKEAISKMSAKTKQSISGASTKAMNAIKSIIEPGVSSKEIGKIDLSVEENYKNTYELFSGLEKAWADSVNAAA